MGEKEDVMLSSLAFESLIENILGLHLHYLHGGGTCSWKDGVAFLDWGKDGGGRDLKLLPNSCARMNKPQT